MLEINGPRRISYGEEGTMKVSLKQFHQTMNLKEIMNLM
jgi:hypothetical protein